MSGQINKNEFLEVYEKYSKDIFRYCCYKVSDREKANDLLQDTFIKTWEYINKGNEVENVRAFLYRTANNLIVDGFRKKKTLSLESLEEQGFDPSFDNTERMTDQMDGAIAMKYVKDLPKVYKEVIIMRFVEQLTVQEIAFILKEKENNVSVRLHRSLAKLRKIIDKQ